MGNLYRDCIHRHGSQIKMEMRIACRSSSPPAKLRLYRMQRTEIHPFSVHMHAISLPSPLSFPPAVAFTNKWLESCPANTSHCQERLKRLQRQENGDYFYVRTSGRGSESTLLRGISIKSELLPIRRIGNVVSQAREMDLWNAFSKGLVVAR